MGMSSFLTFAVENSVVLQQLIADLSWHGSYIGGILLLVMIFKRRLSFRNTKMFFPDKVDARELEALK